MPPANPPEFSCDEASGAILTAISADGTIWKFTVDNAGNVVMVKCIRNADGSLTEV